MITPDIIREKALRIYRRQFLGAFLAGQSIFPLTIPADRGKTTETFSKRYSDLDTLLSKEKSRTGYGYTVELKEVNTRHQGCQSVPSRIFFETENDFLRFINKVSEFAAFKTTMALIQDRLPELLAWADSNPLKIIDHLNDWPELLSVCIYFMEHPRPGLYIRELPIDVHTKFIETHIRILKTLLDFLLPEDGVRPNETEFEKRYGLKQKPGRIRFRILDAAITENVFPEGITDISMPSGEFQTLNLNCRFIFIVENEMNFLAFPEKEKSIVIWGKGFAVENLKGTEWLKEKTIIYWGDIDPHGFEILSMLRSHYPNVNSLMMDMETYMNFQQFSVIGKIFEKNFPAHLTEEENKLFSLLLKTPEKNRLEQEKIPHAYSLEKIQAKIPAV